MYNIIAKHVVRHHLNGDQESTNSATRRKTREREHDRQKGKKIALYQSKCPKTTTESWNLFGARIFINHIKNKPKFDEHKMTKQVSRIYGQFRNERATRGSPQREQKKYEIKWNKNYQQHTHQHTETEANFRMVWVALSNISVLLNLTAAAWWLW